MKDDLKTEKDLALIVSTFENNQDLSYQIFEHMPIGICVTNPQGIFTDVNASYCDIYGYTRDQLIGNNFTMVVPNEHQQELIRLHEEFLDKKYELQGRWNVVDKNDNVFEIITNAAFLEDKKKNEVRKMTLVVKAEKMEKTIEQLRTTIEILENKISTQDVANKLAEHDMSNRISSMVSISDILSKSELDENQKKWVTLLKKIGLDTLKLLGSSKDFARMERGEYKPDISKFDVVAMIASTTSDLDDLIRNKKMDISLTDKLNNDLDPGEDEIIIEGDKFYLEQLFQNLIGNAIEAAPDESLIVIKVCKDITLKVSIHNEGMIPKDIQANFFDKYTTSGKDRGTGLGTYIAKLIANFHKGNISFITSQEDGTTINVELPLKNVS
ncbi:MAG: PAS domain S-box protein [Nonlabens sp.]